MAERNGRIKIVVISMERSTERRVLMSEQLRRLNLPFRFLTAFDGAKGEHLAVSHYDEAQALLDYQSRLTPAEIGCFASHSKAWEKCAASNQPLVVMEDDVALAADFPEVLRIVGGLLVRLPLLRLHIQSDPRPPGETRVLPDGRRLVHYGFRASSLAAYALTPPAARALLEHSRIWSLPADTYVSSTAFHGLPCIALWPSGVSIADQRKYPSTIGERWLPAVLP